MPRKGSAYPITKEWRTAVVAGFKAKGLSQNQFADLAKVSKASLSEALNPESKQSTLVPAIHKALGWPPPMPLVLTPEKHTLLAIYDRIPERDQGALLERAKQFDEQRKR
jgi:transcriptional regulator with XRE-family HTH domain